MDIRHYSPSQYSLIKSWWDASGETAPLPSMLPQDSTFVYFLDGAPVASLTLYLTNACVAYAENLVAAPTLERGRRKQVVDELAAHMDEFARSKGYQYILCMTEKPALVERYRSHGFVPTLASVTTLCKELKCPQQQS